MESFELISLDKNKNIHFIGIGGVSMSALAIILKNDGFAVSGSDFKESAATEMLRKSGIEVFLGHEPQNIKNASCVVYTAAIKDDNPELTYAKTLSIPVIDRAEMLGTIMKHYELPICVSGTHGKTTTTSMLASVFLSANLDPTVLVGGNLSQIGGNMRDGGKKYMITEACEYCASFLKFFPFLEIILNVEEDHLDYFKDLEDIKNCFGKFASIVPENGFIVANFDDGDVVSVVKNAKASVISYGISNENALYTAKNITYNENGFGEFDVYFENEKIMHISLSVTGAHNVSNALAVIAASRALGVDNEAIKTGIAAFTGTDRRFQKRGEFCGIPVIDDYAHHPTEIKATLASCKNYAKGKIWGVFQPHTYTRAYNLLSDFAESFSDCDTVIVTDIYAAREKDTGLINSQTVTDEINKKSKNAIYIKEFEKIAEFLKENAQKDDIVITLGAGDVNKVCSLLTK
ncbi:MAG: UDP-N-acetylmuramate--L-alanine ligase [Clostridia bacterium]|nr:UDP-N-acetylmuramate--L-alanine ligase [Clostridia bacterium]